METAQNEKVPVSLDENASQDKKTIFINSIFKKSIIIFVICVLIFVSVITVNYFNAKKSATSPYDRKVLMTTNEKVDIFLEDTSAKGQAAYREYVESALMDKNISDKTRNTLLLNKATVLAVVRGSSNSEAYEKESEEIFLKIIASSTKGVRQEFERDFATVAFVHQQKQCCGDLKSLNSSYVDTIQKPHLKPGYSINLSDLLTMNDLLATVSPSSFDDIFKNTLKLAIQAEIIDFYGKVIDAETKASLLKDMASLIEMYPYSVPRTYRNRSSTELETKLYYAYGYDIYASSKDKLTSEENKKIDELYKNVLAVLEKELLTSNDKVSLNLMRIYNTARYITSLERRYGLSVSKEEISKNILTVIGIANSSTEIKTVFDRYLKETLRGEHKNMATYVRLSSLNPEAKKYMNSIGISVK
jgi:hypothetical protein